MKNILYILVTLAVFSYILAMPADDSDASEAKATADSAAQKGKDDEKKAEDKVNDAAKEKQQPGAGLFAPWMSMIETGARMPAQILGGFAKMGDDMAQGFTDGLKKGLGESKN